MSDKDEVDRLMNVLRTAIRLLGLTNREIERRLQLTPSYVSRLFAGAIELKVEHVIAISRAIGLQPWEFFELGLSPAFGSALGGVPLHPQPARRTASAAAGAAPASPDAPKMTRREIDEMIQESVRQAFNDLAAKRK